MSYIKDTVSWVAYHI